MYLYIKNIYIYKNKINFWDFSGHPEFLDVRNEFYREAHMLLLVFDLTSKRSFESLDMWVREASD
jgi:DnaJ family protein C protein 27